MKTGIIYKHRAHWPEIERMHGEKKTGTEIAAILGVGWTKNMVLRQLRSMRLPPRPKPPPRSQEEQYRLDAQRQRDRRARERAAREPLPIRSVAPVKVLPPKPSAPFEVRGTPSVWLPPIARPWERIVSDALAAGRMLRNYDDLPGYNRARVAMGLPPLAISCAAAVNA